RELPMKVILGKRRHAAQPFEAQVPGEMGVDVVEHHAESVEVALGAGRAQGASPAGDAPGPARGAPDTNCGITRPLHCRSHPARAAGRAMVSSPTCIVDEPFNGFTAPIPLPLRYQMLRMREAPRRAPASHRVYRVRHAAACRLRALTRTAQAFRSRESA